MQLEEVLMDHDEQGAFEFLKRVVKHKIELRLKSGCKPVFEGPAVSRNSSARAKRLETRLTAT